MINIFQPSLGSEELKAIKEVFESNWLGKGKKTEQFETEFSKYLNVDRKHIRSINSCTEGLFQSMRLIGIKEGDEVILPTISFVGAGNAIASSGAKPVFCDVNLRTLNATAETINKKITTKTKAVMIIHYGGVPCEMDEILELAENRNLAVIEDNACSVASRYKGKMCGTIGDIGTWSFDAMKILVTGDGGMIYCKSSDMAVQSEREMYLGLVSQSGFSSKVDKKWWEFEISCYGRRSIINDIIAAIGIIQLNKLSSFIKRRKHIHEYYTRELKGIEWLVIPRELPSYMESSYYFYWLQLGTEQHRDRLAIFLKENGIYTTFRYYPLHWVKHYKANDILPNAEDAARKSLCIPIHQSLSDNDVEKIVECIHMYRKEF